MQTEARVQSREQSDALQSAGGSKTIRMEAGAAEEASMSQTGAFGEEKADTSGMKWIGVCVCVCHPRNLTGEQQCVGLCFHWGGRHQCNYSECQNTASLIITEQKVTNSKEEERGM